MLSPSRARGFSLIELIVVITILAILLGFGMSTYREWNQRNLIRVSAETTLNGLTVARMRALQLNSSVQFSLVSTLDNKCVLSATGQNWVVSQASPEGKCDQAPSDDTAPRIFQKRSGQEGTRSVSLKAADRNASDASTVVFSGLGRMVGNGITTIDFSLPDAGTCLSTGGADAKIRCLRIQITPAGEARLCDPSITANTDNRKCL